MTPDDERPSRPKDGLRKRYLRKNILNAHFNRHHEISPKIQNNSSSLLSLPNLLHPNCLPSRPRHRKSPHPILTLISSFIHELKTPKQGQTITADVSSRHASWLTTPSPISTVVFSFIVSQSADYTGRIAPLVILTLFSAAGCLLLAQAKSMPAVNTAVCIVGI